MSVVSEDDRNATLPSTTPTETRPSRPASSPPNVWRKRTALPAPSFGALTSSRCGELALGEAEQLAVGAEVRAGGRDVVGRQPGGEVRARVGERFGRAELVEPCLGAGLDLAALPVGRRLAAPAVVDVRQRPLVALHLRVGGRCRGSRGDCQGGDECRRGQKPAGWTADSHGSLPLRGSRRSCQRASMATRRDS